MSSLTVQMAESLAELPAGDWDRLVAGRSYYLSHEWLRAVEADHSARAKYLLVIDGGGALLAGLPVYQVSEEGNDFYRPEALVDGRWRGRYLLAGTRRAYANDLLVRPDADAGTRVRAVRALLEELEQRVRLLATDGALFLYLSTAGACELFAALGERTIPLLATVDTAIDVPGARFDDYLASFTPRQRRKLQHEIAEFERAGYELTEERLGGCWREAGSLLGNLQRRYGHVGNDDRWRSALRRQVDTLGDRGVVFGCRRDGALVGFSLAYPWAGRLYERLAGFDYTALRGAFEYFNLVFYAPLRYVYRNGLRGLHLGRESYDAKVHRGARLAPLWAFEAASGHSGPPTVSSARGWNRRVADRWLERYGSRPHLFADPGWRIWGCGDGA